MRRRVALVLPLLLGIGSCGQEPIAPERAAISQRPLMQAHRGTGLLLNSVTGITVPLIGQLGDVVIDQAVITNFALVENLAGAIVGIEAEGVLQLTGGVLGTDVVTENFTTLVSVTSSGPGKCDLITIDLGPIGVNALNLATVDVPAATLTGRGSGAVGSLLCNVGNLLSGVLGPATRGVQGLLNAVNRLI